MWFLWLTLGMFIGTIVGFVGFCLVSMSRKRVPGRDWMPEIMD